MFQAGKAATIAKEMVRYNLSVLGLAETRQTPPGEVKLASAQSIIYSGHGDEGANHREGVAIMMTKDTRKALTARQRINSRLISAERESGVGSVTASESPPQTSPDKPSYGTPKEKRKRGRPRNSWRRRVQAEIAESGLNWGDLERTVKNRVVSGPCTL